MQNIRAETLCSALLKGLTPFCRGTLTGIKEEFVQFMQQTP